MKEPYAIQDLIDVQELTQIQDCMAKAIGFAAVITDPGGKPITPPSPFSKACEMFHRPIAGTLCEASDKALGKDSLEHGGVVIRPCDHAGLMDAAVPIPFDGRPIGIFLCGQVFFEPPNEELYRQKAKELSIDEEAYLKAIQEVPVVSRERFEAGVELMRQTARMLAEAGGKSLEQQKAIEALKHAQAKLEETIANQQKAIAGVETAKKHLEAQLTFTNRMVELSEGGILILKEDGTILESNQAAKHMFGQENLAGMSCYAFSPPDELASHRNGIENIVHRGHGTCSGHEYTMLRADGTPFISRAFHGESKDPETGEERVLLFVRDITEFKNAQAKLEVERQYWRAIFDSTGETLGVFDLSGRVYDANEAALRNTGYSKEEMLSEAFNWYRDLTFPEDRERSETELRVLSQSLEECKAVTGIRRKFRTKDGRQGYTTSSFGKLPRRPSWDGDRFILAVNDVTELVEARRALNQLVEAQQQTIKELSTPIIPVWSRVLMAPLLGSFDSMRMHDLSERLLEYVASQKPKAVLLDLTGLAHVDTQVISEIVRLITSLRLLGSRAILVGIKPHVAQSLVRLGASLEGVPTHSTLEQGLRGLIGDAGHAKG